MAAEDDGGESWTAWVVKRIVMGGSVAWLFDVGGEGKSWLERIADALPSFSGVQKLAGGMLRWYLTMIDNAVGDGWSLAGYYDVAVAVMEVCGMVVCLLMQLIIYTPALYCLLNAFLAIRLCTITIRLVMWLKSQIPVLAGAGQ